MIQVITLEEGEELDIDSMERSHGIPDDVTAAAREIINEVRERGDAALADYTERFDKVRMEDFRISEEMMAKAIDELDPEVVEALDMAFISVSAFHENDVPQSSFKIAGDGSMVGYKVSPLESVGLYIPGGRACYPSTIIMNATPAKMAGVERVVMVTPPNPDGTIDPALLYAAEICGVDEVYAVGGAQAIAALAYGTESIPRVDKIVGPGNVFVAAAKNLVSGVVGIDLQAGPSEALILADEFSVPEFVASDLLSQAEHDPNACCYLVMVGDEILDDVLAEVERKAAASPRREIIEQSLEDNGLVVVCPNIDVAVGTANAIAPEHLQIMTADAMEVVGRIRNAGAIFVGTWTPIAVGDYIAGPSHTLPTSGTARFSSPLSTHDFVKRSSVISYTYEALKRDAGPVVKIAGKEGFAMHALTVSERIELMEEALGHQADGEDVSAGDDAAIPDEAVEGAAESGETL